MKNNKTLIIIGIILLNVLVVYMLGQSLMGKASTYDETIALAREYAEKDLCTKSLEKYEEAVLLKDSVDLRIEMINVYRKSIEIGEFRNIYDIMSAVKSSVETFRKEPSIYEAACSLYIDYGKYEEAAEILMQARDLNVTSEKIEEYRNEVRYQYVKYYAMYDSVSLIFDGMYTVSSSGVYAFVDSEVTPRLKGGFSYASSFAYGYAFVQSENSDGSKTSYIVNKDGERQAYFNEVETSSGVGLAKDKDGNDIYLAACKVGSEYKYYNLNGEVVIEGYSFAGRFRNDIAAVQEKNGTWKIINGSGESVTDKNFTDIILNEFDECAAKGIVFAKENGSYHMYNSRIEQIGDFSCDEAKPFVDDITAYKAGSLWGFVDIKGNVVIQPQFIDAKPFSNSLGAIYNGSEWCFINPKGEIVIEETYEDVGCLSDTGVCFIKSKGAWSYIKFYYTGK